LGSELNRTDRANHPHPTKYISRGTKNISFDRIDFEIDSFFVRKSNKPIGTFASSKKHVFVDQ
jgi:hypothetical protein